MNMDLEEKCGLTPTMHLQDQMVLGFTRLLASVEDLCLDFPDAAHTLSLFLGRAVIDEALQPAFLSAVLPSLRNDSLGVAVVQATGSLLGARHAAERLQNCWHGGARSTTQLRDEMAEFLAECALLPPHVWIQRPGAAPRCPVKITQVCR